ncbi:MAG: substrate-binding domain-containing protein [Dehalococcoidia bacterium]
MKLSAVAVVVLLLVSVGAACGDDSGSDGKLGGQLILATTTSTQDSGLLDVLVPIFEEETGVEVKIIAVGTGAALEMAARGDADAVLVHAPASEREYVESGDLTGGKLVMHNDFVIVGPGADPAGVASADGLEAAMRAIAASATFVSRGDDSGTNKKELAIWAAAGIDPETDIARLEVTGQGMGATLQVASEKSAYTLTDRATLLAQSRNLDLQILFQDDPSLLNIYHAYEVDAVKHSGVHAEQAGAFVDFMVSAEAQQVIEKFKVADYGQSLFFPDAGKNEAELGN